MKFLFFASVSLSLFVIIKTLTKNYDCDIGKYYDELHSKFSKMGRPTNTFFVTVSCFICSKVSCSMFEEKRCTETKSIIPKIPIYNNLFEFGIDSEILFYTRPKIMLYFSPSHRLKMETHSNFDNKDFKLEIKEIGSSLDRKLKTWHFRFNENNHQMYSFTIKIFNETTVFMNYADDYSDLSTRRYFQNDFIFNLTHNVSGNFEVAFFLHHNFPKDDVKNYSSFPIALPCSPGGYAVDPETGKFTHFDSTYNKATMQHLIDSVINFFYKGESPNSSTSPFTYATIDKRPIYVDECGKPLPRKSMTTE